MDKPEAVIIGLGVGAIAWLIGGYVLSLWAAGDFDSYFIWLSRWAPTCGMLAGVYVGGLVGYLAAVRRTRGSP